jgi:hypothetical protein
MMKIKEESKAGIPHLQHRIVIALWAFDIILTRPRASVRLGEPGTSQKAAPPRCQPERRQPSAECAGFHALLKYLPTAP